MNLALSRRHRGTLGSRGTLRHHAPRVTCTPRATRGHRGTGVTLGTLGQAWSFDYMIGSLLFLFTLLIVISALGRTVLLPDSFAEVTGSVEALSEQLLAEGYPRHWRQGNVTALGLLTDGELSMRKAEHLAAIITDDYGASKTLLNARYDYAVTLRHRNGTVLPVATSCVLGSDDVTVTANATTRRLDVGYYAGPGSAQSLDDAVEALNGTTMQDDELEAFLATIRRRELVILEAPNLAVTAPPYDDEKADLLEAFVARGGTLLLIGNVNLPEAFSLNLTLVGALAPVPTTANGTAVTDSLLNLTGLEVTGIPATAYALNRSDQQQYESLAQLPDGHDYAARFTHGDGTVYYLGGLDGSIPATGETLLAAVERGVNRTATPPSVSCADVELPVGDAKQLVVVRRLVAYRGEIITLTVAAWEER